jgi:hypothetical protein
MSEEKRLILEMLKEGKINVNEAEQLLTGAENMQEGTTQSGSSQKKFLKVLVMEENKAKVNINIPLALAEVGLKLVPKESLKIEGADINIDEILKLIKEGNEGELVNVETTDKGKDVKVKIYID